MIITTTPSVEGRRIVEYRGIVFGEVVSGVNFVRDIAASFSNFFGGRSGSYEEELVQARQNALIELEQRAIDRGANAVVGVDIDYEVLGTDTVSYTHLLQRLQEHWHAIWKSAEVQLSLPMNSCCQKVTLKRDRAVDFLLHRSKGCIRLNRKNRRCQNF